MPLFKSILLAIMIVLFAVSLGAQQNFADSKAEDEQSIERLLTFINDNPSLEKLISYLKEPSHQFDLKVDHISQRLLENNTFWVRMEIHPIRSHYTLSALICGDTICYGKLSWRPESLDSVAFIYIHPGALTSFLERHNAFYQTNIDTSFATNFIGCQFVYGIMCGYAGVSPVGRIRLNEMIEQKDYSALSRWLKSVNPEIQAYGLEGIYALSKMGIKPEQNDVRIMEYLIHRPIKLYACSGCIYGIDKSYNDIVSSAQLRRLKRKWKYN